MDESIGSRLKRAWNVFMNQTDSCTACSFQRDIREIDGITDITVFQIIIHLYCCHFCAVCFRFTCCTAKVWCQYGIWCLDHLFSREVRYKSCDLSAFQCCDHCVFIDNFTTCIIDDTCSILHHGDLLFSDQTSCFIGKRAMQRQFVYMLQQIIQCCHTEYTTGYLPCSINTQIRVIGIYLHPKIKRNIGYQ
mgnify:CR=1 FL=1